MDDDTALTEWEGRFPMRGVLFAALVLPVLTLPIFTGITRCRCSGRDAIAKVNISEISSLIEAHVQKTGRYPWQTAKALPPDGNLFPACFDAFRAIDPAWPGPRRTILVRDGAERFRHARSEEVDDPTVDRYVADPWGEPYVLRLRPRTPEEFRLLACGLRFDLYSTGPDGVDQTREEANVEESDDIGNW